LVGRLTYFLICVIVVIVLLLKKQFVKVAPELFSFLGRQFEGVAGYFVGRPIRWAAANIP
jgi:hypothetical protein